MSSDAVPDGTVREGAPASPIAGGTSASQRLVAGLFRFVSSVLPGGAGADSQEVRDGAGDGGGEGDDSSVSDSVVLGTPEEAVGTPEDAIEESNVDVLKTPCGKRLSPGYLEPGVDGCVCEIMAFVRGSRPGLERLKRVLPVIFDTYLVHGFEERSDILRKCSLIPVADGLSVTFLIPEAERSPVWQRSVRFRPMSSPSQALGSPA